ncbi:MAG TPA: hypothetical protein VEU98_08695 [Candidatus Eremiobacteraceae bacterium]|nr:hypothetical protein [Candidatus Eremiobacteraceae bacterium]
MSKRTLLLLTAVFLMPELATAQSVFDGTWKADLNATKFPDKPDEYVLKDGMYSCKSCAPPYTVKADGTDQKVAGHPYFETTNIKIVDDKTIEETTKKNGKVMSTSKTWVSADGKTMMFEFSDSSASNAAPVIGKGSETRVGAAPAGAHAISGSWKMAKMESLSDNAMSLTYKTTADSITMTTPTGQGYTAKLDGTEAPYLGDPGTTSVSVKKTGPNSLEETDKRDGKVITVVKITVSADGKTMKFVVDDKLHGTQSEGVATKQ